MKPKRRNQHIVALRNEKGSYSRFGGAIMISMIVALRNKKE